jgi:hypothetical protein
MRNPVNADYQCPFINSRCVKRSHSGSKSTEPYPLCSVWKQGSLICVCPKRFFEAEMVPDVLEHCWPGKKPPENPRFAHEVKMEGVGNIDLVIADVLPSGTIRDFVSVELQAVDLTGSVYPAYEALINNRSLEEKPTYNVNWANVRKRYVDQIVKKGFFHHHWKSRIVSVVQSQLYYRLREDIQFVELDPKNPSSNIVFMTYDFDPVTIDDDDGMQQHTLRFRKAFGTSHDSLMMSALYRTPPPRDEFCLKIRDRLT